MSTASNRREFLTRCASAAGGVAALGAVAGAPALLLPRAARAQGTGINQQSVQNVLNAANNLYQDSYSAKSWNAWGNAIAYYFYLISLNGLTNAIIDALSAGVGAIGVPSFTSDAYTNLSQSTTGLLSWVSAYEMVTSLETLCEPAPDQITAIQNASEWDIYCSIHIDGASTMVACLKAAGLSQFRRHPRDGARLVRVSGGSGSKTIPCPQAGQLMLSGGVGAAGGAALVSASGVTAEQIAAGTATALAASTWWTGVTLVIAGLAWAGWWGYETWQSYKQTGCVSEPVKNGPVPY